jgi:hypothetical protein
MNIRSMVSGKRAVADRGAAAAPLRADHAGNARQRQAKRFARRLSVRRSATYPALLCLMLLAPAAARLGAEDVTPSERQLQNDQRFLRGRIETLDRELEPYERDRLRAPTPDLGTGMPRNRQDPLAERKELERRTLQDRERLIEQDFRRQQFDRGTGRGR